MRNLKPRTVLNFIEQSLILVSSVPRCISIYAFPSLICIPIFIASYAVVLKTSDRSPGIKKYMMIIKEERKKAW